MVKLSQQQIKAISASILDSMRAANKVFNDNANTRNEATLTRLVGRNAMVTDMINSSDYMKAYIMSYFKTKYPDSFIESRGYIGYDTEQKIKNEVIMQTIESADLESLINAVKAKFTNE